MKQLLLALAGLSFINGAGAELISIRAQDYVSSENVKSGATDGYGDVIITRPPGKIPTSASYEFDVQSAGDYQLSLRYAAADPRPIFVSVNGQQITGNAASSTTGGWMPGNQIEQGIGTVRLRKGKNSILLSRDSDFPHISKIILDGPR